MSHVICILNFRANLFKSLYFTNLSHTQNTWKLDSCKFGKLLVYHQFNISVLFVGPSVDGYLLKSSNSFLLHVKVNLLLAYPNFNTHVVIDGLVCPNHLAASVLNKRAATWLQTSPSMWRFKH